MQGRPTAVLTLVRALAKLKPAQVLKLISKAKQAPNAGKLERLERLRDRHLAAAKKLERQIAALSGSNGSIATPARRGRKPGRRKGYTLSAATRRKMSEAAKRRYAGKGKPEAAPVEEKPRAKRRAFSAEARAKMAAAAKARWAKVKGPQSPVPPK